jgi:hypothetical protein
MNGGHNNMQKSTRIGITGVIIASTLILAGIIMACNAHLIDGSDARIHRYDANSLYDTYYVVHVLYLDQAKSFNIALNGQGGLYGHEIFTRITWNDANLSSRVNLTVAQLTCVNGTHRIIWGNLAVYPNEFGMFINVNGSWYESVINTMVEVNVCIDWGLKNT